MKAPDVAAQAGITYRQIDHWLRKGWIHAKGRTELDGSGIERDLDPTEVRVALLMGGLVGIGLTPARAAVIARTMAAGRGVVVIGRFVLAEVTQA